LKQDLKKKKKGLKAQKREMHTTCRESGDGGEKERNSLGEEKKNGKSTKKAKGLEVRKTCQKSPKGDAKKGKKMIING